MIYYKPTDGEIQTTPIESRPKHCFLMTQLGEPVPEKLEEIRVEISDALEGFRYGLLDANSKVTGRDFLIKIWRLIIGVPAGIAVIHEDMTPQTLSNIFYELGMMEAYGKETVIVKTRKAKIPSDFLRTEYIEYGTKSAAKLKQWMRGLLDLGDFFETMADQLEKNPLLEIDYLRRAFLITENEALKKRAETIYQAAELGIRARNSVEAMMKNF
ncbi:MAG: hypothetical protein GVY36_11025 [Verrucomicrobia bacterium]|jgi:hypothetical protein|nr:hypothetical protein [Verrucomicrobiota bacterium]